MKQRPAKVVKHLLPEDAEVRLIGYYTDINDSVRSRHPLEVTENHYLWIRRNGEELWAQARDIKEGDELLAGKSYVGDEMWLKVFENYGVTEDREIKDKVTFSFDRAARRPAEGALDVYNISFDDENTDTIHNYGIGSGEGYYFIGHNIISKE